MKIVRATRDNVSEAASLFDAYRRFYKRPADPAGSERFLEDRLSKDESVIFLVFANKQAISFAQLYPSFSSVWMKRLWILNDLFVMPGERRRRAGMPLLEAARQHAEKTSAKGLVLETKKDNLQAQQLYERLGWKRDEMFYHYYLEV